MPAIKPFSNRKRADKNCGVALWMRSAWQLVLMGLLALGGGLTALAYPPAPYHLIYGLVRDQYGTPLMDPQDQVVLQTASGETTTASITPGLAVGVNYALKVPMDSIVTPDLYRSNALTVVSPFELTVVVGGTTNLPIEADAIAAQLGQPAQITRIDLTLGVDANHDGIPDAWENAFLASIGSQLTLSNLNAGMDLAGDGRTLMQEYLLGTYPFDPGNPFAVRMVSQNNDRPVLEFPTMTGRAYTVLGSSDLTQWKPLPFRLVADGPSGVLRTNYTDSVIEKLQIQVVSPTNGPPMQFFKVQLQ